MSHIRHHTANSTFWIMAGCPSRRPYGLSDARRGCWHPRSAGANTGGGGNDGVGGHGAAGGHRHASTGYTSTVTTYTGSLTTTTRHAGGSSGGRRCRSASVALSCGTPETASRATTSTSADKGGHGDALPEPRWLLQTHRGIQGRGGGPVERESHGNLGNTITQFGADLAGVHTK